MVSIDSGNAALAAAQRCSWPLPCSPLDPGLRRPPAGLAVIRRHCQSRFGPVELAGSRFGSRGRAVVWRDVVVSARAVRLQSGDDDFRYHHARYPKRRVLWAASHLSRCRSNNGATGLRAVCAVRRVVGGSSSGYIAARRIRRLNRPRDPATLRQGLRP